MTYNPNSRGTAPTARATARFNQNQTGSLIPKATPVKLTSSGVGLVDVSVEADVDAFAGVLLVDASIGSTGSIINSGTVENVSTSFAVGSIIYVSKVGTLTNVKPSTGVNGFGEGDFVIKIGMIAQNNDNPSGKDLLVGIQIMGQL